MTRHLLALAIAALLTACGGGAEPPAASATTTGASTALAAPRMKPLALATGGTVAPAEAARQLMDFAEQNHAAYFPGHPATQVLGPFHYRHYPATGTYLGVVIEGGTGYVQGGVYVMGGKFGNEPTYVGLLKDIITPLGPSFAAMLAADKATVTQGSTTTLRVQLERLRGFEGPVQVTVQGLPAGVTAAAVTVAANATQVDVTLSAQGSAPHSLPTAATVRAQAGELVAVEPVTVTVRGLPGALDTSFAGGINVTPIGISEDYAHAAAVQPDGKVVLAGSTATNAGTVVALVRYLRDGGLDPGFGNGGKVTTQLGGRSETARAVAVQGDGKIVVAGWTDLDGGDADMLVVRYLPNGALDTGFAQGGKLVLPIGQGTDRAQAIAIQDDGKIVLGGESQGGTSTTGLDFAIVRLLPSGALDPGFGNGGKVTTPVVPGNGRDIVYGLALPRVDGEQRILAVGGEGDFSAARYRANGALDTSFGNGGKVYGLFKSNIGAARAVTLLPGGRMALAGHIVNDFAAAQLMQDGTFDPGFGVAGKVTHPVRTTNWELATAIVRQADGKLILGGWAYSGNTSNGDFVAMRLLPGGALDTMFGDNGIALHPVATNNRNDQAKALVLQADERVPTVRAILGGDASSSNHDFAVMRLWL